MKRIEFLLVITLFFLAGCQAQIIYPAPQPQQPAQFQEQSVEPEMPDVLEEYVNESMEKEPAETIIPEDKTKLCADSDGGKDIYVRGEIAKGPDIVKDSCLSATIGDETLSLGRLVEYYCDGDDPMAEITTCEHGCQEGRCIPVPKDSMKLIENGDCKQGQTFGRKLTVTNCYNDCLSGTRCEKQEHKSASITLPWQLNCLVRTNGWVVEKWLEFDVLEQTKATFHANIEASEIALVEIRDEKGNLIAAPVNKVPAANNRCFADVSGAAQVDLEPGHYTVVVGARAFGKDLLRSFRGIDFEVAFAD